MGRHSPIRELSRLTCLVLLLVAGRAEAQTTSLVVTADGVQLATDVYLPLGSGWGPWPVVLQRTPYGRAALKAECLAFNLWGYVCVAQDVRGRGDSTGTNSVFRDDNADGRATLDWISRQVWSNGKIGTFGPSALGITQYRLAPGAASQLRCQVPLVATPDFYHHAAFFGGAIREELTYNWLAGQDALGFYRDIQTHRLWSSWWQPWDTLGHVESINVPALHVGGWYDIFLQGTLDAFTAYQHDAGAGARGRQHLVVGPWTHSGTGSSLAGELAYPSNASIYDELVEMFRDWFDYWLKGKQTAVDRWPTARVYLMGAVGESNAPGNDWLELPDWPPTTTTLTYHLRADGSLDVAAPVASSVELSIDPLHPVPTRGGAILFEDLVAGGVRIGSGPRDQRELEARGDVAVFSTPPLAQPLTILGRMRCRIWIRPDTRDLDIAVRLTDVYPDGRSMLVTDGIQRARARCGEDRECFLNPGEPAEIVVDLWSTAISFAAGHRIRVDLSGSNSPRFEVNPNDGGDPANMAGARTAHPSILFGGTAPSRLELPVYGTQAHPRRRLASAP